MVLLLGYRQVGKTWDFDSHIRWFESSYPNEIGTERWSCVARHFIKSKGCGESHITGADMNFHNHEKDCRLRHNAVGGSYE